MITDVRHSAIAAINNLAAKATVALIREEGDRAGMEGTGTLFEIRGRHYLVTAAHVVEDLGQGNVGVPCGADKKEIWVLGAGKLATIDKYDVAVFRIDLPASVARLKEAWEFLSLEDIWL